MVFCGVNILVPVMCRFTVNNSSLCKFLAFAENGCVYVFGEGAVDKLVSVRISFLIGFLGVIVWFIGFFE